MRTSFFPAILTITLLLSACGATAESTSIEKENFNPLVASRYGDELADAMANYVIMKDHLTKDPAFVKILEKEIERGKDIADAARAKQAEGFVGVILQIKQAAFGMVLSVDDTLYFSSDFAVTPGPSLHVYLSEAVDPRDADFPDLSAIDLGVIQAVYGPQQYAIPEHEHPELLRTFVLYDTKLREIYALAQMEKGN